MKMMLNILLASIMMAAPLLTDAQQGCVMDGKTYAVGSYFVPDLCKWKCKCVAPNRYSNCVPLCNSPEVHCGPFTQKIRVRKQVALNKKCYCEEQKCIPVQCKVGDRFYKPGEAFVNPDCTGNCYCTGPGYHCVSLCPPSNCSPGLMPVMERQLVSSRPECYCNRIVDCVDRN